MSAQWPKQILVLQNDPAEGPGLIRLWASAQAIEIVCLLAPDCFERGSPPALNADTPVLLLGGAASVALPARSISTSVVNPAADTWQSAEIAWVQQALVQRVPVMGICLGAQMLAKAMGAAVQPLLQPEAGWCELTLHPALPMAAQSKTLTVLQWHEDGFTLPPNCQALGCSTACPQQGFLDCDRRLLGVQFHPEWDAQQLHALIELSGNVPAALHQALNQKALFSQQAGLLDRLMRMWLGRAVDADGKYQQQPC